MENPDLPVAVARVRGPRSVESLPLMQRRPPPKAATTRGC